MTSTTTMKSLYALYKPLPNANDTDTDKGEFLVRRVTDGEVLLAVPAPLTTLRTASFSLEAARSAANLLNHENLVSIHDELVVPLGGGHHMLGFDDHDNNNNGNDSETIIGRRMLLWDYCDAGTLQGVDVLPSGRGKKGWKRVRGNTEAEVDRMPVLHRDIKAENVLLQRPRGIEMYGAVKLGGLGRCWVSGSVSTTRETPVVVMEEKDDVPLGVLRHRRARWQRGGQRGGLAIPRPHRPYTQGSELFAVGALLYRMMVGRALPTVEECADCGCFHITSNDAAEYNPCHDNCVGDVNIDEVFKPLAGYTAYLKALVTLLLRLNRRDEWRASDALNTAWQGFENWAANTDDGRRYRDIFDDIWFRKQNHARLKKRRRETQEDADAMDVDGDVLVV
ncbi:uncharacterized protein B0T15DRAFT_539642 [Chaetomium strumarium]|uniref:Protein kinase domain-containing protein n=1 Tax=Chaetomium strumarium TaxID=1170767 RepID=A0AAJ0LZB3_9PEZI|nr:hypothetical protein B0T15DRAFT_539642 [Chaetomium strumarium]